MSCMWQVGAWDCKDNSSHRHSNNSYYFSHLTFRRVMNGLGEEPKQRGRAQRVLRDWGAYEKVTCNRAEVIQLGKPKQSIKTRWQSLKRLIHFSLSAVPLSLGVEWQMEPKSLLSLSENFALLLCTISFSNPIATPCSGLLVLFQREWKIFVKSLNSPGKRGRKVQSEKLIINQQ